MINKLLGNFRILNPKFIAENMLTAGFRILCFTIFNFNYWFLNFKRKSRIFIWIMPFRLISNSSIERTFFARIQIINDCINRNGSFFAFEIRGNAVCREGSSDISGNIGYDTLQQIYITKLISFHNYNLKSI